VLNLSSRRVNLPAVSHRKRWCLFPPWVDASAVYGRNKATASNTAASAGENELRLVLEVTPHNASTVDWDALVDHIQGCTPAAATSWGRTALVPAGFGVHRLQLEATLWPNELSEESLLALVRDSHSDISRVVVEQRMPATDQTNMSEPCPAYWFQDVWPTLRGRQAELGMLDFIQQPGETIFVPHGWHHIVLNLEWTVAITHNFISVATSQSAYSQLKLSDSSSAHSWHRLLSAENEMLARSLRAADNEVRTCRDVSSDGERSDDEPHDPIHHISDVDGDVGEKWHMDTSAVSAGAAPPPPPPLPAGHS
jgi:translation elongation factor EF-1beta